MPTDGREVERVAVLLESGALQRVLAQAVSANAGQRPAVIALRYGREAAIAAGAGDDGVAARAMDERIPLGCLAKPLTATLARRMFADRQIALDESVAGFFGSRRGLEKLDGITIRHLLEHTHGLDDSLLGAAPRRIDGRVDVDAVLRAMLDGAALASPGAVYSYGSGGPCLVGGLLERVTGQSLPALLKSWIFAPLGIRVASDDVCVCPATGGALALSASDLLRVIESAVGDAESWPDDHGPGEHGSVTPLPGWNPLERGVYLGWKSHGNGWFGHQSVWPAASVFVRAHPKRRIALVVASRSGPAAVIAQRVFGADLQELFDIRCASADIPFAAPVAGEYASKAWCVAIRAEAAGFALHASHVGRCPLIAQDALLVRARNGVHFTRRCINAFPYVQFVASDANEAPLLWNGRFVLRKASKVDSGGQIARGSERLRRGASDASERFVCTR